MKGHIIDAALAYAARGLFVFEARYKLLKNGKWNKQGRWSGKKTNGLNWAMTKDPIEIQKLWLMYPDDPLGIPTGSVNGFFVLDVDTVTVDGHRNDGFAALRALEDKHERLPPTLMAQSPTGSVHYYFRLPPGMRIKNSASEIVIEGDARALGIDVRGEGGMVIAPPSNHPRGGQYRWLNDLDVADAPPWLIGIVPKSDDVRRKSGIARLRVPTKPAVARILDPALAAMIRADAGKGLPIDPSDYFADDPDPELKIRVALSVIPSDDYDVWYRIGAAIYDALGDDGYAVFEEWSRESSKYETCECARKWREFAKMRSIGAGTIFRYADQHDRSWRTLYWRLLNGEVAA